MKSGAAQTSRELALQSLKPAPIMVGKISSGELDDQVLSHVDKKPPLAWFIAFSITSIAFLVGVARDAARGVRQAVSSGR